MSTASSGSASSSFRAKAAEMKNWKPESPPSNRDRLELYALHKQAVSSDAPTKAPLNSSMSIADKAKDSAWRSKRGMSQEEAIKLYLLECDRQMRVYGTALAKSNKNSETSPKGGANAQDGTSSDPAGNSVSLTPRGLTAIPLLCAAASEPRQAYLSRLKMTSASNGWWSRQEPLCAQPDSLYALPENVVIKLASLIETISLRVGVGQPSLPLPPSVIQSLLWPLHNVLLCLWILLILFFTIVGSVVLCTRTVLLGSKATGVSLNSIFLEEIIPSSKVARLMWESHQALTIRLVGLTCTPLVMLSKVTMAVEGTFGILAGSVVYIAGAAGMWWCWTIVFGWLGAIMLFVALWAGWGFALTELASVWVR